MKLSVIVPTFNEAPNVAGALASLPRDAEVIVSDGESTDETAAIASRMGATVIRGPRGRARQMNRGAQSSTGDVLLFVHADCALSPGAWPAMKEALVGPGVVGGSFRLSIPGAGLGLRLVVFGSNLRARCLTPYGDQGLFVRREVFERVGGFPDEPLMEDVALARKLGREGRLAALGVPITTGTRHWQRLGVFRTTLLNWSVASLYFLGLPPARLAPFYRRFHGSYARGRPTRSLAGSAPESTHPS